MAETKDNVFNLYEHGVDVSASPLHLVKGALRSGQNAIFSPFQGVGGIKKRGGLLALNSAAMTGSVVGGIKVPIPLDSASVKTLWAALGSADSDTWASTTDGTSWTENTTLAQALSTTKAPAASYMMQRCCSIGGKLYYAGNGYVQYPTAGHTAPPIRMYDGSTDLEIVRIPPNPQDTTRNSLFVTDMFVFNGLIYIAVYDSGGVAPNHRGRVFSLDPNSGALTQIGNRWGGGSDENAGGMPFCLTSAFGRLWAGTMGISGSAVGKVYWIDPRIEGATWTLDHSTATSQGYIMSMAAYKGNLYVGTQGDGGFAALLKRRTPAGVWSTSDTGADTTAGNNYGGLTVFNGNLYAFYFSPNATPILHARKFDNTSWTTDKDIDASWAVSTGFSVGQAVIYKSNLYSAFTANGLGGDAATDGFVLKLTTGAVWSQVKTGNIRGYLGQVDVTS